MWLTLKRKLDMSSLAKIHKNAITELKSKILQKKISEAFVEFFSVKYLQIGISS